MEYCKYWKSYLKNLKIIYLLLLLFIWIDNKVILSLIYSIFFLINFFPPCAHLSVQISSFLFYQTSQSIIYSYIFTVSSLYIIVSFNSYAILSVSHFPTLSLVRFIAGQLATISEWQWRLLIYFLKILSIILYPVFSWRFSFTSLPGPLFSFSTFSRFIFSYLKIIKIKFSK